MPITNYDVGRSCEYCSRPVPLGSVVCLDCGKSAVTGVADIEGLFGKTEDRPEIGHPRAIDITIHSLNRELFQARLTLPVTVGRSRAAVLVVDDPLISRAHARLDGVRGSLIVTDLESSNGTYLNSARIGNSVVVIGDEFEIGNTVIEVIGIED